MDERSGVGEMSSTSILPETTEECSWCLQEDCTDCEQDLGGEG